MITTNLFIFLMFIYFVFIAIISYLVSNKKITITDSLYWFSFILMMFLVTLFNGVFKDVASFLGVEVVSNLLFFLGFMFLIFISIITSVYLSRQKNKVITLSQEVAILKKKVGELDDRKDKKV